MDTLRYTLITDGSSDALLISIINWLLRDHLLSVGIDGNWADLGQLRTPPTTLADRARKAIELFPCDILFVHRDAENQSRQMRVNEIQNALAISIPYVCLVPIRMQEAWLLIDEGAIRYAADNPNGTAPLNLPAVNRLEDMPDPKTELYNNLKMASELSGRRLRRFYPNQRVHRVAEYIDDFSILRQLSAFEMFENELLEVLKEMGLT